MKTRLLVIGIILIVSGVMFFYHFFNIMIDVSFNIDMTFMNFFKSIMHVLSEMWHFHIPGFVLIISGVYCLMKSKKSTKINNT